MIDTGLLIICSAARPCMALIYPVVYFKQPQYMSEGCICKKVLCMYEFERILRTLQAGLDSTHNFVFWEGGVLKTGAVIINGLVLLLFNDLHPAFHSHLTSTDTCTLFIVVLKQYLTHR